MARLAGVLASIGNLIPILILLEFVIVTLLALSVLPVTRSICREEAGDRVLSPSNHYSATPIIRTCDKEATFVVTIRNEEIGPDLAVRNRADFTYSTPFQSEITLADFVLRWEAPATLNLTHPCSVTIHRTELNPPFVRFVRFSEPQCK